MLLIFKPLKRLCNKFDLSIFRRWLESKKKRIIHRIRKSLQYTIPAKKSCPLTGEKFVLEVLQN